MRVNHFLKYVEVNESDILYIGLSAIIAGLHFSPVSRLKKSFALLSKKSTRMFEELTALTSIDFREFYSEYQYCL